MKIAFPSPEFDEAVAALGPDADPIRIGTMLERLGRALWVNTETEAALQAHEAAVRTMPAEPPTAALAPATCASLSQRRPAA